MHDVIILWKMASAQKDSRFYAPIKTIHNQVKYVVMDYIPWPKKLSNLNVQLIFNLRLPISCLYNSATFLSFVVGLS